MRPILTLLPLLAASALYAQTQPQSPSYERTPRITVPIPVINNMGPNACPVGLSAQQQASVGMQAVVSTGDTPNPAHRTGVSVVLASRYEKLLSTARVLVSYVPATPMLLPVALNGNDPNAKPQTLKKIFDLTARPAEGEAGARRIAASLLVGDAASILTVQVVQLTYADGDPWQPLGGQRCSLRLSHVLRVDQPVESPAKNPNGTPVWSEHVPVNPPVPWQPRTQPDSQPK